MGRSVSYPTAARVVTFNSMESYDCDECDGTGHMEGEDGDEEDCPICDGGTVYPDSLDFDDLIHDFQQYLKELFPSVEPADDWIGDEDHVLAENRLARFGMSEYCGLVSYWIVPKATGYFSSDSPPPLATRWIDSIADKFVAAFGELTKVGSMSNGEGVYRRIDK